MLLSACCSLYSRRQLGAICPTIVLWTSQKSCFSGVSRLDPQLSVCKLGTFDAMDSRYARGVGDADISTGIRALCGICHGQRMSSPRPRRTWTHHRQTRISYFFNASSSMNHAPIPLTGCRSIKNALIGVRKCFRGMGGAQLCFDGISKQTTLSPFESHFVIECWQRRGQGSRRPRPRRRRCRFLPIRNKTAAICRRSITGLWPKRR
jgi:hypothetical protein